MDPAIEMFMAAGIPSRILSRSQPAWLASEMASVTSVVVNLVLLAHCMAWESSCFITFCSSLALSYWVRRATCVSSRLSS